jgi:hypothetical protein
VPAATSGWYREAKAETVKTALEILLFAFGYPVAIAVIVRFVPVVRQRRTRWFVLHEAAVAAICAGHALRPDAQAVIINGTWGVVAAIWYALGPTINRRRNPSAPAPGQG